MKKVYDRPVFILEEFVANSSIAATTTCDEKILSKYHCFIGTSTETESVVLTYADGGRGDGSDGGCSIVGKYSSAAQSAYHPYSGSRNTLTQSGYGSDTYYKAYDENVVGLFVICAKVAGSTDIKGADAWYLNGTQFVHQGTSYTDSIHVKKGNEDGIDGRGLHCHVAPVYAAAIGVS